MYSNNVGRDNRGIPAAVRCALLAGTLCAAVAQAQQDDAGIEEVIVTGSRIAVANMTSTSPILTVSSDEMKVGGRMDISDMLNQLPQINANYLGQDIGNRTSGLSSAGGVSTASLRGLGPSRTLVLVDGRRLGAGSPQTVISAPGPDVDQIPAALVQRVEVVTGGASAVYGSDAIAGVINFITRKNFEGLELDAQLGGNWHNNSNGFIQSRLQDANVTGPHGSAWDGKTVNASLTAGANIMAGRGNVTGYFAYQKIDPVRSSDRDFGSCQLTYTDALDDVFCQGSSNSNYFGPRPGTATYSVKGNQFVPRTTAGLAPPPFFNSQGYIYMQRGDERYNAGFIAHVDVNEQVQPYAEFSFMNDRTHQEVAPTALFRGSQVLTDTGNYKVNCSNPLLSTQQAAILCTPQQIAADRLAPGSASADVEIGRRNVEGGGRTYDFEHTNYRLAVGTKGRIAEGWSYDTYGQYYYTSFSNINGNDFSFDKIANALQVTGTAAAPRCISGGACVPYNIFRDGGVTQTALDYLETLGTATGSTELRTFHADTTGDLGVYGLKMPTAEDGVGMNVGFEYRKERVRYQPDAAFESGLIVGNGGAYPRIDNSLAVKEGFAEVRVPLVQQRPGVHDLLVDAGYRYSDYSTGVTTDTYKFELQYAPVADYRFRASYNRAIRAPNIVELFVPQLVGKIAFGEDPCAPGETTGVASEVPEYRRHRRAVRQWRQHQQHSARHRRAADTVAGRQSRPAPGKGGQLHRWPDRTARGAARLHRQHRLLPHQAEGRGGRTGCADHHAQLPGHGRSHLLQPAGATAAHRHAQRRERQRPRIHRADQCEHRFEPAGGNRPAGGLQAGPGRIRQSATHGQRRIPAVERHHPAARWRHL
jgi:iron complex outermembrane recepter protein